MNTLLPAIRALAVTITLLGCGAWWIGPLQPGGVWLEPVLERSLTGRASWYRTPGLTAAAGPALRVGDWRGSLVRVSAGGRSVVVELTDFCGCYRGTSRERLLDLSDGAFAQLAPLAVGVVWVRVTPFGLPATDTEVGG